MSDAGEVAKILQRYGGRDLSGACDHPELRVVVPPKLHRADWEIQPSEIDLTTSELIGKVSRSVY